MALLIQKGGRDLCGISADGHLHDLSGDEGLALVKGWLADGVPSRSGVASSAGVTDPLTTIAPADPAFWPAFAEAATESGLELREVPGGELETRSAKHSSELESLEKGSRLEKGGPFIGPKGGKWADPQHKIAFHAPTKSDAAGGDHGEQRKRWNAVARQHRRLANEQPQGSAERGHHATGEARAREAAYAHGQAAKGKHGNPEDKAGNYHDHVNGRAFGSHKKSTEREPTADDLSKSGPFIGHAEKLDVPSELYPPAKKSLGVDAEDAEALLKAAKSVVKTGKRGGKIVGYRGGDPKKPIYEGKGGGVDGKVVDPMGMAKKHAAAMKHHGAARSAAEQSGDKAAAAAHGEAADAHFNALHAHTHGKDAHAGSLSQAAHDASKKAKGLGSRPQEGGGEGKSEETPPPQGEAKGEEAPGAQEKPEQAEPGAEKPQGDAPQGKATKIDDAPLAPGQGSHQPDLPAPGGVSPESDSSEHDQKMAELQHEVESLHEALRGVEHLITGELVPMFNALKGDMRRGHGDPHEGLIKHLGKKVKAFLKFVAELTGEKVSMPGSSDSKKERQGGAPPGDRSKFATDAKKKAKTKKGLDRVADYLDLVALRVGLEASNLDDAPLLKSRAGRRERALEDLALEALEQLALRDLGAPGAEAAGELLKAAKVTGFKMGPPPFPNRSEHPYVGSIELPGKLIADIETEAGGTRSGTDSDGKDWSVRMPAHYGEIRGTVGTDGDPLDVFIGDDRASPFVYLVAIKDPKTGAHDEDKAFLGFRTRAEVEGTYRAAYDRRDLKLETRRLTSPEFLDWCHNHENHAQRVTAGEPMAKSTRSGVGSEPSHGVTMSDATDLLNAAAGNLGPERQPAAENARDFANALLKASREGGDVPGLPLSHGIPIDGQPEPNPKHDLLCKAAARRGRALSGEQCDGLLAKAARGEALTAEDLDQGEPLSKGMHASGPFIGPKGGKWADPQHKVPWTAAHSKASSAKHDAEYKRHTDAHRSSSGAMGRLHDAARRQHAHAGNMHKHGVDTARHASELAHKLSAKADGIEHHIRSIQAHKSEEKQHAMAGDAASAQQHRHAADSHKYAADHLLGGGSPHEKEYKLRARSAAETSEWAAKTPEENHSDIFAELLGEAPEKPKAKTKGRDRVGGHEASADVHVAAAHKAGTSAELNLHLTAARAHREAASRHKNGDDNANAASDSARAASAAAYGTPEVQSGGNPDDHPNAPPHGPAKDRHMRSSRTEPTADDLSKSGGPFIGPKGLADGTPLGVPGFGLRKSDGRGGALRGFLGDVAASPEPEAPSGPRLAREPLLCPSARPFSQGHNALMQHLAKGARIHQGQG